VKRQLVFAYGSLADEKDGVPCRLRDHRCHWGVAMDNRETIPGYKLYLDAETGERPAVEVAYLSIAREEGATVDGVALRVTDEELAALDLRERNYVRRDVTELVDDVGGRVWAYVGSRAGRRRLANGRRCGTAVISRGYLETVPGAVPPDLPVRRLLRRHVGA
jgi:gamma-glutamylcyclotransferase (GGCT)/AIG2-like uncharacterized protein YtfP